MKQYKLCKLRTDKPYFFYSPKFLEFEFFATEEERDAAVGEALEWEYQTSPGSWDAETRYIVTGVISGQVRKVEATKVQQLAEPASDTVGRFEALPIGKIEPPLGLSHRRIK